MSIFTVDYGHALVGSVGARGCGYLEEVETRKIGRLVTEKLRSLGHTVHEVYLDNAVDMRTDLNYRVNKINSIKPDLSISIHLNAFSNASANGTEVWADKYCWNTAQAIANEISSLGYTNRGVKDGSDSLALVGLYGGTTPALLCECCFITNSSDMSKYNIEKIATAIVKGVTGKTVGATTQTTTASNTTVSTEIYRVRKTWADTSSQIGAYSVLENAKNNCPSGYSVFDSNGNKVYSTSTTTSSIVYRIRKEWNDASSQKGAYSNKDSAIDECKKYAGYSVYDDKGNAIYTTPKPQITKKYVNLKSHMTSWRVYPLNKTAIVGNQCGTLNPSLGKAKGGLTYTILEERGNDVYVINTSTYGKVQIYCPNDNDGSVSNSPLYEFVN